MSRDSKAMSEHTPSIRISLDDDISSPRTMYSSDDSSISDKRSSSDPSSGDASLSRRRPREVILPDDWSINDFLVDISNEVFSRLRPHFQIPRNVPIRKGDLGEKCYDRKSSNIGFYKAMFIVGLRLPLSTLHHRLAFYLGVSVSQIAPNAWRIFIGVEVLWGQLSGGNCSLTLEEFFYCYKPQEIPRSKGFYNFMCHQAALSQICLTLTVNGKLGFSLFKGSIRFVALASGIV